MSLDEHRSENGRVFKLGWVQPSRDVTKMRASDTSVRTYRRRLGLDEVVPDAQVPAFDMVARLPKSLIEYQRQYGACTNASATGAMTRRLALDGHPVVKLSWCQLYDKINDGRDDGSNIRQSLSKLISEGVVEMSLYDDCKFDKRGAAPPGAELYKETLSVTVDDSDTVVAAILARMPAEFPICVDKNFERYDEYGFCGLSSSKNGNHAVYGGSVVPSRLCGGHTGILVPNSWDVTWGPFVRKNPPWLPEWLEMLGLPMPSDPFPLAGCCLIRREAIDRVSYADDGYAHAGTDAPPDGAINPGV